MAKSKNKPKQSAWTEINERLTAFTADQLICSGSPLRRNVVIVGLANDHLRRLHTLAMQVVDEHNVLAREALALEEKIDGATKPPRNNPLSALRNLISGGLSAEMLDRYEELVAEIELKAAMLEVIQDLFWLEAKTQFPELVGKPIASLFEGWKLGWSEKQEPRIRVGLGGDHRDLPPELFGEDDNAGVLIGLHALFDGDPNMPPELKEIFDALRGRVSA